MKYIITGGSGLIGRKLCELLVREGHIVYVLSRSPDTIAMPQGVTVIKWDAKTGRGWGGLVENVDAIVNLAGENIGSGRWSAKKKEKILRSRLNASEAILDALKMSEKKPRLLIQASAVGYYGTNLEKAFTEKDVAGNDYLSQLALEWEQSTQPVEEFGVSRIVIRTGVVLSPRGGVLKQMVLPFKLFVGGSLGSGKQWISWIHEEDEVRAIYFLLQSENISGTFNLTSPNPVTNAEFERALAKTIHKPYWFPVPGFMIKALFGEMSMLVVDGQKVMPEALLKRGFAFKYLELESALSDILS
ncbi:MAG: TIGR01777 family oxidoreductase [Anaerolineaceae bacterium]